MRVLYLGIDQGSSSTKAVLIDKNCSVLWSGNIELATFNGPNGVVEQDGKELASSVEKLIEQGRAFAESTKAQVGGDRIVMSALWSVSLGSSKSVYIPGAAYRSNQLSIWPY